MEDLPYWYPLKRIGGEASLEELLNEARKRIDFLFSFKSEEHIMDINHNFVLGNLALSMVAAVSGDAYFTHWFLETEADVFEFFFNRSDSSEKIKIMNHILGEMIIGISGISEKLGIDREEIVSELATMRNIQRASMSRIVTTFSEYSIAAARFNKAYKIIRREGGILISGWVIAPLVEFYRVMKGSFQRLLEERIQLIRSKIMGQCDEAYNYFSSEILKYWREKRSLYMPKSSRYQLGRRKLWQNPELFPPCSRILYDRFISTGYIAHDERVQLALFLKGIGMPLEEQLKFWYRAVDNVGVSWEDYLKKGGYYIRHIYGLEGSRKDYSPPKCETIISKYFCPFRRVSVSDLSSILRKLNPKITKKELDDITELCFAHEYRKACLRFLVSLIGRRIKLSSISHPIQFVRILTKFRK